MGGRRSVLWWEDWRERSTAWSSRAGRHGSSAASSAATHASMSSRPPAAGACCAGGGGGVCAGDCDGVGSAMPERESERGRERFAWASDLLLTRKLPLV